MARLHLFSWEQLELSTLNTRRFLFRSPESLSRWLDQASLGFARSTAKRTARFWKLRTESVPRRLPEITVRPGRIEKASRKRSGRGMEGSDRPTPAALLSMARTPLYEFGF